MCPLILIPKNVRQNVLNYREIFISFEICRHFIVYTDIYIYHRKNILLKKYATLEKHKKNVFCDLFLFSLFT